jgi:heme/copper-type cytochrome/quinol oxidase subunit 3
MFFAGLIGAFVVLRLGSVTWPPPQQPRLPGEITALNTLVLIMSGFAMRRAVQELRKGKERDFLRAFFLAAILGTLFLVVQGFEWIRLVHFGLTVSTGIYGSTFYTLVGFHGGHVLGAVLWLTILHTKIRHRKPSQRRTEWVELCAIYWYFVVGLWPIIYGLVYLS